jgi:nitrogen fixation/metabolism regulation signal transduction histidine kinase
MLPKLWWMRHAALALAAIFFLLFGIQLLISAYRLTDPFYFVLTFFSSNLIILISIVLLIGFVYQIIALSRVSEDPDS